MKITFLEVARLELDEAVSYYNGESPGLGEIFLAEILSSLDRIKRFTDAWPPMSTNTRRCRTRRFPCGLIYRVESEELLIIAVAHLHRKPDYWADRVKSDK